MRREAPILHVDVKTGEILINRLDELGLVTSGEERIDRTVPPDVSHPELDRWLMRERPKRQITAVLRSVLAS
ncbi:hypothetical protein Adeg_1423 [Ammonifex degensii KC4]|uniref:Uncharacterized protein n=1 Tax=Ammonifex degensii (strain DSM 10501 / KC4) TaxID=429009 RepID=C9R895_AMMDK|nr:hypothetical protein [Ammonifex degensii]ACX52524.1 hypothetical protein Adeg_1423 [Ammonifex degensii KC4]